MQSNLCTQAARAIWRDLETHARNTASRRAGLTAIIARSAREARREALADIAETERQVIQQRSQK